MAGAIQDNDFYKISTSLRYLPPSVVFNNPEFLKSKFKDKICYAILTMDRENNKIEASICWQDSGFDLTIEFQKDADTKKYKAFYTTKEHDNWLAKYDAMIGGIVKSFIEKSLLKIDDALVSKQERMDARNFKGVYFKKKNIGEETPRFIEVVDSGSKKGIFTKQFKSFVKKHSNRLSAAGYPAKDY